MALSHPRPARPPGPGPELPLAPAALALATGVACGYATLGPAVLACVAPVALILAAHEARLRAPLFALLLGLLLGRGTAPETTRPPAFCATALPAVHVLEGRLTHVDPTGERSQRLVLRVEALGQPVRPLAHTVRLPLVVQSRGFAPWRAEQLTPGTRVRCLARISLRRGRLLGTVHDRRALEILAPATGPGAAIARLRHEAAWTLSRAFDARDDGLARALLLGDRGRLDPEDRRLFRRTGQAHLLAVSGLHVGLLLGGLLFLLRVLGCGARLLWSVGLLAVIFYVPFAGSQPSAVRAGTGAAVWFIARLAGRRPRGAALLVIVVLLVLMARPSAVGDVSFQLSFAAVTAIFLLARRLRALLVAPRPVIAGLLPPRRAPLRSALAISTAAWIGTAPFVAEHIGRLCPAGPLLSLPALPLTAVLLGSGFLRLVCEPLAPPAAAAGWLFETAADLLRTTLALARSAHLDAHEVARPAAAWWALYAAALCGVLRGRGARRAFGWVALTCMLGALFIATGLPGLTRERTPWIRGAEEYDAPDVATLPIPDGLLLAPAGVVLPGALEVLVAGAGLFVFSLVAIRLRWLGARGAGAAWALGLLAFLIFHGPGLWSLVAPFLVATLLGKLPGAERSKARDLRQVLCNGVPAFAGCLLAISGRPDLGGPFFLGALACLGADTCATEIGIRYGGAPFRLAGRGPIRSGESGGVTGAGLLATLGGAALAPGAFLLLTDLPLYGAGLLCAAGVAGSLLDSILGGWLQFRGRDDATGEVTEVSWRGCVATERVSGWRWLDNDAVNLVSGMASGVIAVALAHLV